MKTADDSINDTDTESSIRTVSDADGLDPSKAESVSEDIPGKLDYCHVMHYNALSWSERWNAQQDV